MIPVLSAMSGSEESSRALLRAVAARDLGGLEASLASPRTPQLVSQGLPALHVAALRDWAPGVTALIGAGARGGGSNGRVC